MFRRGLGLMLAGLVATAQAAQPDEVFFAPRLDLLTTQFAHSGINFLPAFQIGASVMFTRQTDALPIESSSGSTSRLFSSARLQQEIVQTTNANWQPANGSDRISLSHLFRLEFKEEQVNITLRFNSALIERKQLKLILQPHSTAIVWSKAF